MKIKPVSHLKELLKNEVNLSSFTEFERFETIEKTTENIKIGRRSDVMILIIVPVKSPIAG